MILVQTRFSRVLFLVVALASVGQIANTIFVPAMAMIAHSLHISSESVQLLMAAYLFPYGISQFIYGPLSDTYGRRPMILIGLAIFAAGSLLASMAADFHILFTGCVIQGCGTGVAGVMSRTVIRDCYSDHKLNRANSFVSMALIIAPLAAPLIGGYVSATYGWRATFIFLLVFAAFVLAVEFLLFKETHIGTRKSGYNNGPSSWERYKIVLSRPDFNGYLFCLTLTFSGVAVFEASAGILFTRVMHFDPKMISLLFVLPIPGYLIGCYSAAYISQKMSTPRMLFLSVSIIMTAAILLTIPAFFLIINLAVVLIPITIFMFGAGLLYPIATTCAINPLGEYAGTAGAVLGGGQNLGAGIFTALFTLTPQTTQRPLALVLLLISVLLCISTAYALKHSRMVRVKSTSQHTNERDLNDSKARQWR